MRKIEELSTVELAKLNKDEFEKLLNEEKAEAGIPIVCPQFPVRNTPPKLKSICTAYRVCNMYILNRDKAKRVSDFLSAIDVIDVSTKYEEDKVIYLLKPNPMKLNTEIDSIELCNIDDYEKRDADICNGLYDTKESYEKKKDEYYETMDRIRDFNSKRTKIYLRAIDKLAEMDKLKRILNEEYIPISKGDRDMAMAFLKKAYPNKIDEETEKYIMEDDGQRTS